MLDVNVMYKNLEKMQIIAGLDIGLDYFICGCFRRHIRYWIRIHHLFISQKYQQTLDMYAPSVDVSEGASYIE